VTGEFLGQLVFQASGDTTTIPVTVTVSPAAFTQLNRSASPCRSGERMLCRRS